MYGFPNDPITEKVQPLGQIDRNQGDVFPQFRNGRVINVSEKPTQWYQLFDNNRPNDNFKKQALYGIQNYSSLSLTFFSKENVQLIQDMIRYNVWMKSGKKFLIGEQSTVELEVIMRGIYLQHARNLDFNIKEQVKELNNMVLQFVVPQVMSGVEQYFGYLHNIETMPVSIEHPKNMSIKGTKLLRSVFSTF